MDGLKKPAFERHRIQCDGAPLRMGVDSADFNQDGWMDLFVANIDEEIFSLYQNNHDGTFDDQAMRLGSEWPPADERVGNEIHPTMTTMEISDLFLANGSPTTWWKTISVSEIPRTSPAFFR